MSWRSLLKIAMDSSRGTFNDYQKARRVARSWSIAEPHAIREKNGKFTVMMVKDTRGSPEEEFGPIKDIIRPRFSR